VLISYRDGRYASGWSGIAEHASQNAISWELDSGSLVRIATLRPCDRERWRCSFPERDLNEAAGAADAPRAQVQDF
jgi:hypothetical protein